MALNPLLVAGALATVGSAGLNMGAQGQVAAARRAAEMAELQRQERWDNQIRDLQKQSLNRFDNFTPQMDARAGTVADFYKASGGSLPSSGVTAGIIPQTSGLVAREGTNQMNKVNAFNDQQGTALGNLRSFGDIMGAANRGMAIDSSLIGGINNMKQGSSNVLQSELEDANRAGGGMKSFADILSGLGKIGVAAGLSGGGSKLFGGGGWNGQYGDGSWLAGGAK
jgi:hypothetical protein